MHQFGLGVSEGRLVAPGGEFKAGKNDRNLQVLRQSLFLAFGKTSLLVWDVDEEETAPLAPTNCTIQNVSSLMKR